MPHLVKKVSNPCSTAKTNSLATTTNYLIFLTATLVHFEEDDNAPPTYDNFQDTEADEINQQSDTSELIEKNKKPVWSFAFYQAFFDVDTSTILKRVKGSLIPLPNSTFSSRFVKGKPDMYGPFWICATLVLSIGVCGNLSTLINNIANPTYKYHPQFDLLPIAAIIIYSYAFVLPLLIKGLLWWRNRESSPAVSQLICLYGYSLFVYIPSSVLFIVPYAFFNWLVVAVAISLSGAVILLSLWPIFRIETRKMAIVLMGLLFALHVITMVTLRLYFFSPVASSNQHRVITTNSILNTATNKTLSNH